MDFERVFKAYFKDVFLYVRSLSAEEGLAEEITQETFVKALKAIDAFDGKKIFGHGYSPSPEIHIIHIYGSRKSWLMSRWMTMRNLTIQTSRCDLLTKNALFSSINFFMA